jgi:hypothetical protein
MIRKVYLDTCCIIYLLEDVPFFSEQIRKHMTNNVDATRNGWDESCPVTFQVIECK